MNNSHHQQQEHGGGGGAGGGHQQYQQQQIHQHSHHQQPDSNGAQSQQIPQSQATTAQMMNLMSNPAAFAAAAAAASPMFAPTTQQQQLSMSNSGGSNTQQHPGFMSIPASMDALSFNISSSGNSGNHLNQSQNQQQQDPSAIMQQQFAAAAAAAAQNFFQLPPQQQQFAQSQQYQHTNVPQPAYQQTHPPAQKVQQPSFQAVQPNQSAMMMGNVGHQQTQTHPENQNPVQVIASVDDNTSQQQQQQQPMIVQPQQHSNVATIVAHAGAARGGGGRGGAKKKTTTARPRTQQLNLSRPNPSMTTTNINRILAGDSEVADGRTMMMSAAADDDDDDEDYGAGYANERSASVCSRSVTGKNNSGASTSTNSKMLTPEERAKQNRDRNREHARSTRLRKKAYVAKLKELVEGLHAERTEEVRQRRIAIQHLAEVQKVRRQVVRSFLKYHTTYETDERKWSTLVEDESFWFQQPITPYRSFQSSEIEKVRDI